MVTSLLGVRGSSVRALTGLWPGNLLAQLDRAKPLARFSVPPMSLPRSNPLLASSYDSLELEEGGLRNVTSPMLGRRRGGPGGGLGPPGRRDWTGWAKVGVVFVLGALVGMASVVSKDILNRPMVRRAQI